MSTQTTELHQRFILQIHPSVSESSAKSDAYGTESVLVPSPSRMTLWAHDTRGTSPWSSNIDPMSSSSELASQAVPNRNEGVIFDTEPIPGFTTADCNTVSAINAARTDCPSREVSIQGGKRHSSQILTYANGKQIKLQGIAQVSLSSKGGHFRLLHG